jgi:serine/threonine-protein kinase PknG
MAVPCTQPGCAGTIEDGYCNVCGAPERAPAPEGSAPAAAHGESVGAAGTTPTRLTTSNRLAATAIGSSRNSHVTRRLHGASARTRAPRLGAGITTVPAAPVADPRTCVLDHPEVPEERRFCPACNSPVGRTRDGHPGKTEGFCPKCRTPYSFAPKLKAGDVVAGQYEVVGCIAHGGLGWIYLARDHNVSDRYVVLKGLLNSGDADAYAAAVAEREFLAEVEHPLIVEIYNFVLHEGAGYIVMEFVGGRSLKEILKDRQTAAGGRYDPFPPDVAAADLVEILPAFAYLHSQGLLYCDFKPDNVVQVGDSLKLIDLGGVRRANDQVSAIYGTTGYQAPEVADVGPSIAGDLFTIGRALAVMTFEFRGYQSTYATTLPPAEDIPVLQRHDSLTRFLLKACAADPDDRFQGADEMRDQLIGVLREIVALDAARSAAVASTPSALFEAPSAAGATLDWTELAALRSDPADPAAAWLAGVSIADPAELGRLLDDAPEQTVEVHLARALAGVRAGDFALARSVLEAILGDDPWEWRAVWIGGLAALAEGDATAAVEAFNAVFGQVPGELAPKLALALACEAAGQVDLAEQLYTVCARTDAAYTAPAAFGLARVRGARGDTAGSLEALDLVAPTSRAFVDARRLRAELLARSGQGLDDLAAAMDAVATVSIDPRDRQELLVAVLESALGQVRRGATSARSTTIAGVSVDEPHLRKGLEAAYRDLATMTPDANARWALIDKANRVRPRTLL